MLHQSQSHAVLHVPHPGSEGLALQLDRPPEREHRRQVQLVRASLWRLPRTRADRRRGR